MMQFNIEEQKEHFFFELSENGMTIQSSTTKDFYLTLANLEVTPNEKLQLLKLKTALDMLLFPETEKIERDVKLKH